MTVTYEVLLNACRNGVNRQVEGVELGDVTVLIEYRVGLDTCGMVIRVVLIPMERQIQFADSLVVTTLFDHMQVTDAVTTECDLRRVAVVSALGDGLTIPINGLTVVEQERLRMFLNGRYIDLHINRRITRSSTRPSDRVAVNGVLVSVERTVNSSVDILRISGADVVLLNTCRHSIHCQVQGVVADDVTGHLIRLGVFPDTGAAVVLTVLIPGVRQVQFADALVLARFLYNVQYADAVATVGGLNRVTVVSTLCDVVAVPIDGLVLVQDACLGVFLERRYIHLYIYYTIALTVRIACRDGVAVNAIGLVSSITVGLTADVLRCAATYVVVFGDVRSGIDCEVQAVDTVRIVNGRVAVFILLGRSDRVLQCIADMILRTRGPVERQCRFTDRGVVLVQVGRINDED